MTEHESKLLSEVTNKAELCRKVSLSRDLDVDTRESLVSHLTSEILQMVDELLGDRPADH